MPLGPDFISLQVRDLDTAAAFTRTASACAVRLPHRLALWCSPANRCRSPSANRCPKPILTAVSPASASRFPSLSPRRRAPAKTHRALGITNSQHPRIFRAFFVVRR